MNLENFTAALDEPVQPDKNLKILISGLALCHFDDESGQWIGFFPKVRNHKFRMIVTKKLRETNAVIEQNTFELFTASKIEVITNQTRGGAQSDPQLSEDMVNLCKLHEEHLPLTSDKSKYAGFLLLNEISLTAKTNLDPVEHEIWRVEPFPNPQSKVLVGRKQPAAMIDCGAFFEPGSITEIRVTSQLGFSVALTHEENIVYQIAFDNDCHGQNMACDVSDFKFYYNIIDESQLKTKQRFEVLPVFKGDRFPDGSCLTCPSCVTVPAGLV
jgi:hypothetical protein